MPRKDRSVKLAKKDRVLAVHVTAHLFGARLLAAYVGGVPLTIETVPDEIDASAKLAVKLIRAVDQRLAPLDRKDAKRKGTTDRRHGR